MGQRANLVIVRQGDWRLFYDHWCANRLDIELFWGPRLAAEFIEQRRPMANRYDWLDEVWCEGGAVLDEDERVLVWFGGEDIEYDVPLRRALFELMARQWPGWELRWAAGAIAELGEYVGIPKEQLIVDSRSCGHEFCVLTEYPEDNDTLVTLRIRDEHKVARVHGDHEALEAGPSQLRFLLSVGGQAALDWIGDMPTGGLHVDVDARELHYWRAAPVVDVENRVRRAWPGWRTVWLRDRFEDHLRLSAAEIRLPRRAPRVLQRDLLAHVRRCCAHKATNPARETAALVGATDLNPWTDETRGSVGREDDKLLMLDRLLEQIGSESTTETS